LGIKTITFLVGESVTKGGKSFIPLTPEKISNFGWKQKQLFSEEIQPGNIRSHRAMDNQRGG
jgi:hypothetical protein